MGISSFRPSHSDPQYPERKPLGFQSEKPKVGGFFGDEISGHYLGGEDAHPQTGIYGKARVMTESGEQSVPFTHRPGSLESAYGDSPLSFKNDGYNGSYSARKYQQ